MVADENRQKQGKHFEKKDMFTFFVLSPLILHIINENTALLKEKEIFFFTSVSLNKYNAAVSEKNLVPFSPCLCPIQPCFLLFFFFIFFFTFY
jgi:hypothetical protein